MKIILDAFGGDNAPLCVLQGARDAIDEYDVDVLLCGDEEKIKKCAADNNISLERMSIKHAPRVMDMHEDPNTIIKSNSDTSLAVALYALANGEGDGTIPFACLECKSEDMVIYSNLELYGGFYPALIGPSCKF